MNILQCSWAGKNTLTKKPWGIKMQARKKPRQRGYRGHSARQKLSRDNLIPAVRFYLYWPTGEPIRAFSGADWDPSLRTPCTATGGKSSLRNYPERALFWPKLNWCLSGQAPPFAEPRGPFGFPRGKEVVAFVFEVWRLVRRSRVP